MVVEVVMLGSRPVCRGSHSGAATGAEPAGAGSGSAGSGGAETEGAEPGGAETGGAEPGGAATGGTEPGGAGSTREASRGALSRREVLSPQELREWFARRWGRTAGAGGTTATPCPGGAGAAGPGGPAKAVGVGPTGSSAGASGGTGAAGSAGPGAAGATGVGAAGGVGAGGSADAGTSEGAGAGATGGGGTTGAGAPAGSPGAVPAGSGGALRPRPYFVPLLDQVLGLPPSPGPAPPLACPQLVQSQSLSHPVSLLPAPSPYTRPTGGLAERRASASRPASPARPVCTSRRTSRLRPPAVPGTHLMALRPSTAPLRVPLPSPPESSLPAFPDPESDSLRAASPTVARFLATVVTDPSLASTAASALVAELVDFAASCRLDYAASLVAESASVCPLSVGGSRATQKRRATDSPATEGAAANLSPSQVAALLALLQKQAAAPVTTPAATTKAEKFASAKTANIRNNVSTSSRVAASHRADKGKAPDVEDEPAAPDDSDSDSDSDAGEEPNNPMPLLPNDLLPPLPSPHPSTAAAAFNRKGVRDQAEVFEALQTYLGHVEHKIRGGDAAGALKTVGQAQDLIKRRFDVLVVADHAGFDVAERYQLLKTTAVLTSRSFKMAVADMAALKRMKTGFARGSRLFHRDSPHFMPKTMGSGNSCRGFKGTCFRCGQNDHMASACPHGGHGGNVPTPVV
ncbi:unnamed protein product [Closterium sp. NIES-53]